MAAADAGKPQRSPWKRNEGWVAAIFLLPTAFFVITYIAYPIFSTFRYSLFAWSGLSSKRTFLGLENYRELFNDPILWKAMSNTVVFLLFGVLIILPFAFAIAMVLSKAKVKFAGFLRSAYFFPIVLNLVVIGTVWSFFYNPSKGLLNQILTLVGLESLTRAWLGDQKTALMALLFVSLWMRAGYYIVVYLSGIESIHLDIWDALKIDGAGLVRSATSVIIPMMRTVISSTVTMALIYSINDFGMVWVITQGGPIRATEILGTYMFKEGLQKYHMGYGSAIVVLMLVLSISVSIIQMRMLERKIVEY